MTPNRIDFLSPLDRRIAQLNSVQNTSTLPGADSPGVSSPLGLPRFFTSSREVLAPDERGSVSPAGLPGEPSAEDLKVVEQAVNLLWEGNASFRKAFVGISKIEDDIDQVSGFCALAEILAKAGKETEFRWVLNLAAKSAEIVVPWKRSWTQSSVAMEMAELAVILKDQTYMASAIELIGKIENSSSTQSHVAMKMAELAVILKDQAYMASASELAGMIGDPWGRSAAQKEVSVKMAELGMIPEAQALMASAAELVGKIGNSRDLLDLTRHADAQKAVIVKMAEMAVILKDRTYMAFAEEAAGKIDPYFRPTVQKEVVVKMAELAMALKDQAYMASAIELVRKIGAPWTYHKAPSEVAVKMAKLAVILEDRTYMAAAVELAGESENPNVAQSHVAMEMLELGMIPEAQALMEAAAESAAKEILNQSWRSRAQSDVAVKMTELGMIPEGRALMLSAEESAGRIDYPLRNQGHSELAIKMAKLAVILRDRTYMASAAELIRKIGDPGSLIAAQTEVAVKMTELGMIPEGRVLMLSAEESAGEIEDPSTRSWVQIGVALKRAEIGSFLLKQASSLLELLGGSEGERVQKAVRHLTLKKGPLFVARISVLFGDQELISDHQHLSETRLLVGSMILLDPDGQRKVRQEALKGFHRANDLKKRTVLTAALRNLNELSADSSFFEFAKKRLTGFTLDDPEVISIIKGLVATRRPKALNLAVRLIGDPAFRPKAPHLFPWQYRFWLVRELEKVGHLEKGISNLVEKYPPHVMNRWLQGMVAELGLTPSLLGLKLLIEGHWKDENEIPLKTPETVIAYLKKRRATYSAPTDSSQLIAGLARNPEEAFLYYLLFGGRTRFALIDKHLPEQFREMVRIIHAELGPVHKGPMKKFAEALYKRLGQAKSEEIIDRLCQGKWPLDEAGYAKSLRIDVSSEKVVQGLKERLQNALSSDQLGAIIEATVCFKTLTIEERNDSEIQIILQKIENSQGLLELSSLMAELKQKVPALGIRVESRFGSAIGKLPTGDDPIAFKREVETNLRKELSNTWRNKRQTTRDPQKKKELEDKIAALEKMKADEVLVLFIEEQLKTNGKEIQLTHRQDWRSHIKEVFDGVELVGERGMGEKVKRVTYRYLDKGKDLIEVLRFADGVQNCFTSEGRENIERKKEWLTRIWKDPLSFVFLFEDNEPDASERNAIGFVFGSFGVIDGDLAVVLNGVYIQGKTNEATLAILNATEEDFSRPIGASYQMVAATHGGQTWLDPAHLHAVGDEQAYSNEPIMVTRLRALSDKQGNPEIRIYDDLGVGVNQEASTAPKDPKNTEKKPHVWWKRIDSTTDFFWNLI